VSVTIFRRLINHRPMPPQYAGKLETFAANAVS